MAYKKRRTFRRKRRVGGRASKYSWYNNQNMWDIAKDVSQQTMKYFFNTERKFLDTSISPASVPKTGNTNALSVVQEGTDYNQRNGLSIRANSLYLRGYVQLPATATIGHVLRIIVYVDSDDDSGAPSLSDLLESVEPNSPLQHTNGKRFKILYDALIPVSNTGPDIKVVKWFKKIHNHIRFSNSTTGTRDGQIYISYLSDTNTAGEEPLWGFDVRLRFIDN